MPHSNDRAVGNLDTALANAIKLLEERAYAAALAQSQEIRRQFPREAQATYIGAVAKNRLGDSHGALKDLRALAKQAPTAAPILHELGLALRGNGRIAEAQSAFEQAVQANPGLARAWQP